MGQVGPAPVYKGKGDKVAQWVALGPHTSRLMGSTPTRLGVCVEFSTTAVPGVCPRTHRVEYKLERVAARHRAQEHTVNVERPFTCTDTVKLHAFGPQRLRLRSPWRWSTSYTTVAFVRNISKVDGRYQAYSCQKKSARDKCD